MTAGRTIRDSRGFTLIELMVVTVMISVVMGAMYTLYKTQQRSALIQEEVVDLQQNLRIAMDSITRDVRMCGFLSSFSPSFYSLPVTTDSEETKRKQFPIRAVVDNAVNTHTTPTTDDVSPTAAARIHADMLSLNIASSAMVYAKIAESQEPAALPITFTVETSESLDAFTAGATDGDYVRILETTGIARGETTVLRDLSGSCRDGTTFMVTAKDRTSKTITLQRSPSGNGCEPVTGTYPVKYNKGSMIVKIPSAELAPPEFPTPVMYCLGPATDCALGNTNCPRGANDTTMCLYRINNGTPEVIASRITGLQFTYLIDGGTYSGMELPTASTPLADVDLRFVRAIRVNITGQTANAVALSEEVLQTDREKMRTATSIIRLENRNNPL